MTDAVESEEADCSFPLSSLASFLQLVTNAPDFPGLSRNLARNIRLSRITAL